jgi:hypothetical protein
VLASHHTCDRNHAVFIGDDNITRRQCVSLSVQREELLTFTRAPDAQSTAELRRIEDVHRLAKPSMT